MTTMCMKAGPLTHKSRCYRTKIPEKRLNKAQVQAIEQCKRKLQKYLKRARAANGDLATLYGLCRRADRQADKANGLGLRGNSRKLVDEFVSGVRDELIGLLEQSLAEPDSDLSSELESGSDSNSHMWHVTIESVPDEDGLSP